MWEIEKKKPIILTVRHLANDQENLPEMSNKISR